MASRSAAKAFAEQLRLFGGSAFNLRHTFPEVPQGSTDNLMDYAGGTDLYKPQWDLIHNPEVTTGLFDDMEDGAQMLVNGETDYFDVNGKYLGTRTGQLISEIRIADKSSWDFCKLTNDFPVNYGKSIGEDNYKLNNKLVIAVLNYYYSQYYKLSELKNGSVIAEYKDDPAETDYDKASNLLIIKVGYNFIGTTLISKFDVLNMFIHERGSHGEDWFKYKVFNDSDRDDWERSATLKMIQHETWSKTSNKWKKTIFDVYGSKDKIIHEDERQKYFTPYGISSNKN